MAMQALPVSNQLAVHGINSSLSQLLGLEGHKPIPFAPAHTGKEGLSVTSGVELE